MDLIDKLIEKYTNGKGRDFLNAAERETVQQLERQASVLQKDVTVGDLRALISGELTRAHHELESWDNPDTKQTYYQALAHICSLLLGLSNREEERKRFIEALRTKHNL